MLVALDELGSDVTDAFSSESLRIGNDARIQLPELEFLAGIFESRLRVELALVGEFSLDIILKGVCVELMGCILNGYGYLKYN